MNSHTSFVGFIDVGGQASNHVLLSFYKVYRVCLLKIEFLQKDQGVYSQPSSSGNPL